MTLTLKTMTLAKWKRLRKKTFVRCPVCGKDLWPNDKYYEEIENGELRRLCKICGLNKIEDQEDSEAKA